MKDFIVNFLKGVAMGVANVIAGVSGGTIALIVGIFERLINSLKSFNFKAIKLLFTGKFKEFAKHTDFVFLLFEVLLGIAVAMISVAKLFKYLFENYPTYIWALFFGLLLASIFYVGKTIKKWNVGVIVAFVIGIGISLLIAFGTTAQENDNFFYLNTYSTPLSLIYLAGLLGHARHIAAEPCHQVAAHHFLHRALLHHCALHPHGCDESCPRPAQPFARGLENLRERGSSYGKRQHSA